jgi:menaquinone-dependent protoporphyrinogen IX oxidase
LGLDVSGGIQVAIRSKVRQQRYNMKTVKFMNQLGQKLKALPSAFRTSNLPSAVA